MPFLTLLSLRSSSAGTQGTPPTTISSKALLMSTFTLFGMTSVRQLLDKVLYAFFQDFIHFITFRTPALCSAKIKALQVLLVPNPFVSVGWLHVNCILHHAAAEVRGQKLAFQVKRPLQEH